MTVPPPGSVLTDEVVRGVSAIEVTLRPVIVAVSGFGGSGKTTLAADLAACLGDTAVVSIDDFARGRLRSRSGTWAGFDRARLAEQVLRPARAGLPVRYQRHDWVRDAPGEWVDVPRHRHLVVEGISTLHPHLLQYVDYSIWLDLPLEVAVERGIRRDRSRGNDHDALWRDVWGPNDADWFAAFRPDRAATVMLPAFRGLTS